MFGLHPFLRKLFADGGYQGPNSGRPRRKLLPLVINEIVQRSDQAQGFEVLRADGWSSGPSPGSGECSRLAKDFENLTRNALAFIRLASIRLMARKLFSRLNFPDRPSHAHADDDAAFGMEIENDVFPKRRQQSRRPTAYQ